MFLNNIEFQKAAQEHFIEGAQYGRYAAHALAIAMNPYHPMSKQAQDAVADGQMIADQMNAAEAGADAGMGAVGGAGGSAADQIQCPNCGSVVTPDVSGVCPVCGFNIIEALMASTGAEGGAPMGPAPGAPMGPAPEAMPPEQTAATEQVVQAALSDPNIMANLLSYNWVR